MGEFDSEKKISFFTNLLGENLIFQGIPHKCLTFFM